MTHNMPQQSGAQTPDDRRARIEAPLRIKLCLNSPRGEHRATNAHNIVRNGLHALLPQRKAANRFPLPKPTKAQAFARNAVCSLHGHAVQRHRPTPIEDVGINFSPKVERNAQRPSPAQATVWSELRTKAGNRQKKFGIGKTCGNCRRFTGVCRANDPLPAHFQNFEPSPGRIVRASRFSRSDIHRRPQDDAPFKPRLQQRHQPEPFGHRDCRPLARLSPRRA